MWKCLKFHFCAITFGRMHRGHPGYFRHCIIKCQGCSSIKTHTSVVFYSEKGGGSWPLHFFVRQSGLLGCFILQHANHNSNDRHKNRSLTSIQKCTLKQLNFFQAREPLPKVQQCNSDHQSSTVYQTTNHRQCSHGYQYFLSHI